MVKKITLVGFWLLVGFLAMGQAKFSATITPGQIHKNEYATLRLIVENSDVQKISPPSLDNFNVVSGPNQESGMTSVNGQVSRYVALSFVLQPKSPGKINIGAATAQINGKVFKSNPIKLMVSNVTGSSSSATAYLNPLAGLDPFAEEKSPGDYNDYVLKPGENVAGKVGRNMQMRLETDKKSCFVGEPIVAEYKLYTRLKSESRLSKNPSFNGFSVIDLQEPDVTGYSTGKLNGREYNIYTIRKAQLYPLQPGEVELEAATIENRVQFIRDDNGRKSGSDIFNQFSISPDEIITETVSLTNKPVVITVKPLPEAGRPPSFAGAVGNFDLSAEVEKNNFSTDETGRLLITVTGSGNLQLVTAPEINWPQGIEAFEPKFADDLNTAAIPVRGKRTFEYSFSIQNPGEYTLAPVVFSFFDPRSASYKIVSSKPVTLNVAKGSNKSSPPVSQVMEKDKTTGINNIFNHRGWMVIVLAALVIISLIVWLIRDKKKNNVPAAGLKDTPDETINMLATAAIRHQNPLSESEECLGREECIEFYEILNRELKTFLVDKFKLNPLALAYRNIMAAMDKAGVDNAIALQVEQLLHDIEWQLYTPFQRDEKMEAMYSRAQELIQMINTYHPVTQ